MDILKNLKNQKKIQEFGEQQIHPPIDYPHLEEVFQVWEGPHKELVEGGRGEDAPCGDRQNRGQLIFINYFQNRDRLGRVYALGLVRDNFINIWEDRGGFRSCGFFWGGR